jgi:hypothetical protein
VTRDEAIREVAQHGWTVYRETKKGYVVMHRGCGMHQETLHKTPSRRDHFKQKAAFMITQCSVTEGK